MSDYSYPELEDATDGALRVTRRKALYCLENAMDIHDRLELDENGEYQEENTIGNLQGSIGASSDMMAKEIKLELDRRGADYKSRAEIMG